MSGEAEVCCEWSDASITGTKAKQQSQRKDGGVKSFYAFISPPDESGSLRLSGFSSMEK